MLGGILFFNPLSFLFLTTWNIGLMAGAPAAILKREVILRVEAKYKLEQKARGLTRAALASPILRFPIQEREKKIILFQLLLSCVFYLMRVTLILIHLATSTYPDKWR